MNPALNLGSPLVGALSSPEIQNNIFGRLSLKELGNCRLVNGCWRNASLGTWRDRVVIRHDLFTYRHKSPGTPAQQILAVMETPIEEAQYQLENQPFRKFRARIASQSSDCTFAVSDYSKEIRFWNICGSWMHSLELTYCDRHVGLRTVESIIFSWTPNLKKLSIQVMTCSRAGASHSSISGNQYPPQRNLKCLTIDLGQVDSAQLRPREIVRMFPDIDSLKVRNFGRCNELLVKEGRPDPGFIMLVNSMSQIRKGNMEALAIKHLDLMDLSEVVVDGWSVTTLTNLLAAKFPLESFKLDLGVNLHKDLVSRLLPSYSSTLKVLHCFRAPVIPVLPSLFQEITFTHLGEIKLFGAVVSNFDFTKWTPNLEILHVFSHPHTYKDYSFINENLHVVNEFNAMFTILPPINVRLKQMKELHGNFNIPDWIGMYRLARWMPNISSLSIPLNSNTFIIVCQSWKGTLKNLELPVGSIINDVDITGVAMGLERGRNPRRREHNITDLRNLEKFFNHNAELSALTYHSVRHGFLHLRNLKSIRMMTNDRSSVVQSRNALRHIPDAIIHYGIHADWSIAHP